MQIIVIKKEKLYKNLLTNNNMPNYWIKDYDEFGNQRNLIMLEKNGDSWQIVSNDNCVVIEDNKEMAQVPLRPNNIYLLKTRNVNNQSTDNVLIYSYDESVSNYHIYQINNDGEYTIGSLESSHILFNNKNIGATHAILTKNNGQFYIKASDKNYSIYVNDYRQETCLLKNGDIIFIMGYKLIVLNNYLIINHYGNDLTINSSNIVPSNLPSYTGELMPTTDDDNAEIYSENDYYSKSPRFVTSIFEEELKIDSPPGEVKGDDTPVIYTIGPMLTMAMSSVVSASVSIMSVINGNGKLSATIPTIAISVIMLISTILWPSLMRRYNKKKQKANEQSRQEKYINYLEEKKNRIEQLKINQYQVLNENFPEPKNLETIIINKRRNLWERKLEDEDFLSVRLGIGNIPLKLKLNYASEDFSMSTDQLKEQLNQIANNAKEIANAPVTISLTERNKLVIIGENAYKEALLKSIIFQLATYHSYDELKLVLLVSDNDTNMWHDIKNLPHLWSNSRDIRFLGNNFDDMSKISFYLEQVYMSRKYSENDGKREEINQNYKMVMPYYLIIVDNIKKNKNIEIVSKILSEDNNLGFGLIILNDGIGDLPNECKDFITAAGEKSAIIKNDLNKNNQQTFIMDSIDSINSINLSAMCERLANIPIKLPMILDDQKSSIGFLEMYKVGKVENLNIFERWEQNNPVNSLSVPIGIHTDGELFNLDLHEKFYGPHGLIAGMTGSGKSEFIITFILSMCINFNPEEVSFVLIDYKGGGLTGAFENKLTGVRLPHLAGTITNLDKAEIKRSLSSIESELKRRQTLFNQAKLELNESTLDIYKYQKLYRDGRIKTPISHLFIISDEFAELKSQQPEFMDGLISAARIGRSLGVHLILATQKPSGIVDDQIWSNSKFKICLKVQERSDSMDVIKCPDAAGLKQVGRFYLQVGYNDYFAMGQSAYSGVKYIPKDKIAKTVDRSISFINNIGDTIKSIETTKKENGVSLGEELPNILAYICNAAKEKNISANKLWLDKIPGEIFINDLIQKYNFKPRKWDIRPIIGEYDDPSNQKQDLLMLDYNDSGNTLIYGVDGKDIMITSIIYSLLITHGPDEINIYVIDFGTEIFGMFKDAPQVGDVVFLSETEKLNNLISNMSNELEKRKKLFIDYNGDYNLFIKNSGQTLPRYIIIINNYEAFNENYEDYIDTISSLSREGERYGISFIITATGANSVRSKVSQNFSNQLCLQFNDPSDYSSVLGTTHGMVPSDILGRGLIKIDSQIYEYQTAYPCKWNEVNTFIRNICHKLSEVIKIQANTIAVLPQHVRLENVISGISNLKNVPIGIEKKTLRISTFDFNKNIISLVASQDTSLIEKFILSLGQIFQKMNNVELYMFDIEESASNNEMFNNYYTNDYKAMIDKLEEKLNTNEKDSVFIINGIDNLKNNLTAEDGKRLKTVFESIKANNNMRIVLADSISKIKNLEYEDYYRRNVQPTNAIWIGSGITDQFTIKSSTYNKETRSALPNDFGYNVNNGNATLIKLLDFYTEE